MAEYSPFMNSTGLVTRILTKIKDAKTPDRFTQDYLGETRGFSSGSAMPFIPLAKRLGLLATDGKPTELYNQFRNPDTTKGAMAKAIRQGYADLYARNEKLHALDKSALEGVIVQATGLDSGSSTLRAILGTFKNLAAFADFGQAVPAKAPEGKIRVESIPSDPCLISETSADTGRGTGARLPRLVRLGRGSIGRSTVAVIR